jgi:long-chain acyl-CoA synthetase
VRADESATRVRPSLIDATQAFRDTEIFLTGANGFVGKVVLGLMVDRFPNFKHLHLLMRGKAGNPPEERFQKDVLGSPSLKAIVERAGPAVWREKITLHQGDVSQPQFGLSNETLERLRGRVGILINCAGLVEFFPPVDESFRSNVDGAESSIAVAKKLEAKLVHISTCFVCGESDGLVEESEPIVGYYPRRKGPNDRSFRFDEEIKFIREQVAGIHERAARSPRRIATKEIAQQLIDLGTQRAAQWGWVNIYTYSKSLGEQIIASEPGLDWAIVRPAIVEAALEFPFPGWVEGGRTAAPLVMMAMAGLRHWPLRADAPMEVVPVDQVATSILTAAAALHSGVRNKVYQIGTADSNPVPLGKIVEWMYEEHRREKKKWLPTSGVKIVSAATAKRRGERLIARLAGLQYLAAGMRRMAQRSRLPGRRALGALATQLRMLGLQVNIREQTLALYQPFMLDNRFVFEAENIRAANAQLADADRTRLPWTPERIDWRRYWIDQEVQGIQKWVAAEFMKGKSFKI